MRIETALTYDDVLLKPQLSDISSRSEVDLSVNLGNGVKLGIPLIASPMDTISGVEMAVAMDALGGLAIIHRYNTINEQADLVASAKERGATNVGGAVGVNEDYYERAEALVGAGANVLCVDVAHGFHTKVAQVVYRLTDAFPYIHIMSGNVATKGAYEFLSSSDSVRVGVGSGSCCTTRINTGHGLPALASVSESALAEDDTTAIIADGGIRNSGDIVKALAAGARAVMLGSILSGTDETPGNLISLPDGSFAKEFRGMASRKAQMDWRSRSSSPEGVATHVPYKGSVEHVLADILGGVRSGLSYSGARSVFELQSRAIFVRQTPSGSTESRPHIRSHSV